MLGHFKDSSKLKDENRQTVNKYQKPIALFAKHLKMAATDGTTIVDVTAGTGTTAVREGCNPGECLNGVSIKKLTPCAVCHAFSRSLRPFPCGGTIWIIATRSHTGT